ncbi:MAG: UDP-N-acetylglucosamine 2-epimerase [Stygiobacter sp. RIFOXYC12_FULL_38_8]|nr:MAG: UDP-N-acetylglucosamine 2-epimerase [Stygiobacter sp. GWC2_38_9]OGU79861.1 MAG: UDP-N-acetylglucosamine 2-epimerase [Stygiobacter sp. RIFOXYA12_FULL_38_9]OGV07928.1 MAG: UDP-N-acetylglucosamine 2-epimerase [Stygiobacter sp. RIFOXYB2_FULL_37_11]OGV12057.1 MAG: UDP-N-acetylglucosamine 2-epimerase [Stygiobacter sp. RIFOXYA2_FULL_38_8]OGV14204.1 MAG: UDP-N-acetylglucosamine 2-epimerase [Stygiobacter sp. RIFOXYC2_FULL_38_25]OGV26154.1 MAG: UDP-N-acetylglucosamine 2-epimerase [Stygiobacter s
MQIVTITGIRPDFIRMSKVFEKLDQNFNHIMVHTGQHYDDSLSKIFFSELKIRKPDFTLETGKNSTNHYEQLSYLSKEVIHLLKKKKINPEIILFLGDSNSVLVSAPLFKEGYKIGHIEGGMRSYDRRMPEEVNRVICDYVSDSVFVYTPLYKERLIAENKNPKQIHVVGNTIVEIVKQYKPTGKRSKDFVVADVHRTENLKTHQQFNHILDYINTVGLKLNMEVKLVKFNRAAKMIEKYKLLKDKKNISLVGPYGFLDYLNLQYNAYGIISDSGTSQEECPLLGVPVAVPRKATERPESVEQGNSIMVGEDRPISKMVSETVSFFKNYSISPAQLKWLGDGKTSDKIVSILKKELQK